MSIFSSLKLLRLFLTVCFSSVLHLAYAAADDTLNMSLFGNGNYVLYPSPVSGFASGNNAYGDIAKAQVFKLNTPCNITGLLLYFGYVKNVSQNDSSIVRINFYKLNQTGLNSVPVTDSCPGDVFYSTSLTINQLNDTALIPVPLSQALFSNDGRFATGIDFSELYAGDSVALYSSAHGTALNENSWEKDYLSRWFTILHSWSLHIDLAIFPIVNTSVGIAYQDKPEIECYPNPASEILYAFIPEQHMILSLFDSRGAMVKQLSLVKGPQQIPVHDLSDGLYHLNITSETKTHAYKILVSHNP